MTLLVLRVQVSRAGKGLVRRGENVWWLGRWTPRRGPRAEGCLPRQLQVRSARLR